MDTKKLFAKFTPKELFQMSLIALGGMVIFVFITGIYIFFWTDFTLFFRILSLVNTLFGVLFLSSTFISTYQSYQMVKLVDSGNSMMQMAGAVQDLQNLFINSTNPDEIKEEKSERGVIKD